MTQDQYFAIGLVSMLGTYGLLLFFSKRYRDDTAKMFRLEKTSLRVAVDNPLATLAHILSFVVPVFIKGFAE